MPLASYLRDDGVEMVEFQPHMAVARPFGEMFGLIARVIEPEAAPKRGRPRREIAVGPVRSITVGEPVAPDFAAGITISDPGDLPSRRPGPDPGPNPALGDATRSPSAALFAVPVDALGKIVEQRFAIAEIASFAPPAASPARLAVPEDGGIGSRIKSGTTAEGAGPEPEPAAPEPEAVAEQPAPVSAPPAGLGPRERRSVKALRAAGNSVGEIAWALGVSTAAVEAVLADMRRGAR